MGESLKDPFEPLLPELQPETVEAAPAASDVEPLADWILNHEALSSEPENSPRIPAEELKEIHFERRHEIKDEPKKAAKSAPPSVKQMVPISHVLKTHSLLPTPPSAKQQNAAWRRLRHILKPSSTQYAAAILQGFAAGLVIIVIVAVIWGAKLLAGHL